MAARVEAMWGGAVIEEELKFERGIILRLPVNGVLFYFISVGVMYVCMYLCKLPIGGFFRGNELR